MVVYLQEEERTQGRPRGQGTEIAMVQLMQRGTQVHPPFEATFVVLYLVAPGH